MKTLIIALSLIFSLSSYNVHSAEYASGIAFHSGNQPGVIESGGLFYRPVAKQNIVRSVICTEEDPKTAFLYVEFSTDEGVTSLKIQGINVDGSIASEEIITGSYPEVTVNTAVSDQGEDLVVINTIADTGDAVNTRILFCQ